MRRRSDIQSHAASRARSIGWVTVQPFISWRSHHRELAKGMQFFRVSIRANRSQWMSVKNIASRIDPAFLRFLFASFAVRDTGVHQGKVYSRGRGNSIESFEQESGTVERGRNFSKWKILSTPKTSWYYVHNYLYSLYAPEYSKVNDRRQNFVKQLPVPEEQSRNGV